MYDKEASNKELSELCEAVGVEVVAKGSKPTKAELTAALDEYYGVAEEAVADENESEAVDETVVGAEVDKSIAIRKKTKAQIRKEQYDENMKLVRVLVTSNATNQTKTELTTISWGNRLLGYHTDRVILGKPWHVRQGALNNMKDRKITNPVQNEEQNRIDYVTVPAYNIVDLGLLSMKEYKEMAEKQKAKNASMAIA